MPAYYRTTVGQLLHVDHARVIGELTLGAERDGFHSLLTELIRSWRHELSALTGICSELAKAIPGSADWGLLLEYPIPRRQKRLDTVLLDDNLVFAVEFKIGASSFSAQDKAQVEDYALDLRDFHAASAGSTIIPILVATSTIGHGSGDLGLFSDAVKPVLTAGGSDLAGVIAGAYSTYHAPGSARLDPLRWDTSSYKPVPTIIEAAEMLFAHHGVMEIARSHAGVHNLTETTSAIMKTIEYAQSASKKVICFVTGVPGAGKTLAGLNVIHSPELRTGDRPAGSFLSGNGPLVNIVSEALSRNDALRTRRTKRQSRREVTTFIRNVHVFMNEYVKEKPEEKPYDHVVVFDEAQRAWSADKAYREFERESSEPEMMLKIMDRHPDWAVLVALVGGGQEIYDGEAGLAEWGLALKEKFPHWEIVASPEALNGGPSVAGSRLFDGDVPETLVIRVDPAMHLPVSIRSFRAEAMTDWVNAVLSGEADKASRIKETFSDLPIALTRSLERARAWLVERTRGLRRCGLVTSSGALRLRAFGLEVSSSFRQSCNWCEWFLAPRGDVRSSYQLEVAATEFECQGLELDWVGLCWGNDFTWDPSARTWEYRRFRGNKWNRIKKPADRVYLLNKYRVLLSRTRDGLVIWVPPGLPDDPTLDPERLDGTAAYLLKCGAEPLQ